MKAKNLLGQRIGRLTVIERLEDKRLPYGKFATWSCRCDCGKTIPVLSCYLLRKATRSCGCFKKEVSAEKCIKRNKGKPAHNRLPDGEASARAVYSYYQRGAYRRKGKKEFELLLSYEEFKYLISKNCVYCDTPPSNKTSSHPSTGTLYWNGIDRIDPTKGYILENCQTCCIKCNTAKLDMSEKEFLEHIQKLASYLLKQGKINLLS